MSLREFIEPLAERLGDSATVKTVYGEPVEARGKTIIPVARVAYGLGGGSEVKKGEEENEEEAGGGGGVRVNPIGVLEVTNERTRFIRIGLGPKIAAAVLTGVIAGYWIRKRREAA